MKTLRLVCIFSLILGLCSFAIAEETKRIATVAETEGRVEVRASRGKWAPAEIGMVLREGDIIRTQTKSSARLNLDGNAQTATIQIKEKSKLTLTELVEDQKNKTQKTLLDLALGQILIKARKLHSEKSSFEVKTPTSIVGVRGTTFAVNVEAIE